MRVIKDDVTAITLEDIGSIMDFNVKTIEVPCHVCGNRLRLTESYINSMQKDVIDRIIKSYGQLLNDTQDAIIEIYGEDPRMTLLAKRMQAIKNKYENRCVDNTLQVIKRRYACTGYGVLCRRCHSLKGCASK